jgi:hypothetical protein
MRKRSSQGDGTISGSVRERTFYSICGLAVLVFGCPKRQTTPRLVYVPAPPSATEQAPGPASGTLVIQEPAAPEPPPEVVIEEPRPEEKPVPHRRRPATSEQPANQPPEEVAPAAEVPALEPRESPAQQTAQRRQIIEMLAGTRGRIAYLRQTQLSALERKTLDDAQNFLEQSQHALETNDLARALNLARKASLLTNAMQ